VEIVTANGLSTGGHYGVNGAVNGYGRSMHVPAGIYSDNGVILPQFRYHTPGHVVDSLNTISGPNFPDEPHFAGLYELSNRSIQRRSESRNACHPKM
jgi:hypothetical protein